MMITLLTFSNTNPSYSQTTTNSFTFEDPLSGVQFEYTDEWIQEGSSLFGAEAECSRLPCMKLPEISISVYPIATEDFSIANYTQEQISYHNTSQGYTPIALNETKIGEKNAYQYAYSTKPPLLMEEASNEIINYEIYTTEGINLYKISFTALKDEQLDNYLNSFKQIINTFTLTK
jgi:hypothetical protein